MLALLGLGALVGYWLSRPKDTAPWLTVEVPRVATAGQPLIVRVIPNAATPATVTADLHWSTTRRESRGMLSGSPAQRIGAPGAPLTFRLEVPAQDELGYVRAIVYAGPTAGWNNRVEAATSDYIPVASAGSGRSGRPCRSNAWSVMRPGRGRSATGGMPTDSVFRSL
ncbi:MAG: hypothetical protein NTV51_21650 [Verrucomicrobia bacterium]|nr:hypothetical protein [Verrucomicrobiota bacterium]